MLFLDFRCSIWWIIIIIVLDLGFGKFHLQISSTVTCLEALPKIISAMSVFLFQANWFFQTDCDCHHRSELLFHSDFRSSLQDLPPFSEDGWFQFTPHPPHEKLSDAAVTIENLESYAGPIEKTCMLTFAVFVDGKSVDFLSFMISMVSFEVTKFD